MTSMVLFTEETVNFTGKSLLHLFHFLASALTLHSVCELMVTIINIETFVTFAFDPFLVLRLITDSDLDRMK